MSNDHLTFRLSEEFIDQYRQRPVPWGFQIGAGNTLGEWNWIDKYSNVKDDGTNERWFEGCRRVVEGTYTILKNHCLANRTPWNHAKAARAAEDMYERLFTFKWTPPGRGLWMMGREFIFEEGSAALQNCAFLSTEHLGIRNPTGPFLRLMEMSMLGIGVGFDTLGADKLQIHEPDWTMEPRVFVIPDSREGWCESTDLVLRMFLLPNQRPVLLDYSKIRPAGEPIKRFGGKAAGPGVLKKLHERLIALFMGRGYQWITSLDILDINNMIGQCVVAGNVRRSAEIALGVADDKLFLNAKNWHDNPTRMGIERFEADGTPVYLPGGGWGGLSNNSLIAEVGGDYSDLADTIAINGEPGLYYLDLARAYGRLGDRPDNKDWRAAGCNPCAEQTLENNEACTLVETYPIHHDNISDYLRSLKVAYLYAKAVTLMPTHWPETNEVMTRNRRIGTSMTGIAQFAERHGWAALRDWCEIGYEEITSRDVQYSEWLGVRGSIKTTSVKPSGTVSLLAGVTPGVHWPENVTYIRRIRGRHHEILPEVSRAAGYTVEPDVMDPDNTLVMAFPTRGPQVRNAREVSVWEKVAIASLMQKHWADNNVSATFTFTQEERSQIGPIIRAFDGQLKSISFLPFLEGTERYAQLPYEEIQEGAYEDLVAEVKPIDFEALYHAGIDPEGEKFCANDVCEVPRATP